MSRLYTHYHGIKLHAPGSGGKELSSACISVCLSANIYPELHVRDIHQFLPRNAMHPRYMLWPCVRPSVCLSVTSRCSTKTAKRRITQTTPHDTPGDSSLLMPKISAKFDRGHPIRGRQMQVGWVKIGDFRQITGYISKTVQDRHIVSIKVE